MSDERTTLEILNSWTDALSAVLAPFGIVPSGVDAASILPGHALRTPLEALRALSEADIADIAALANEDFETDQIAPAHIEAAIAGTLRHWPVRDS